MKTIVETPRMANHLKAKPSAIAVVPNRCPINAAAPIAPMTGMTKTAAMTTAAKTGRALQRFPLVVGSPTTVPLLGANHPPTEEDAMACPRQSWRG
jgi:hypothetical protein